MDTKKRWSYAKLTWGMICAVFNKLGGIPGAQQFLRGDTIVVASTEPEMLNCHRTELDVLNRHLRSFGRSIPLFKRVTTRRYPSIEQLFTALTDVCTVGDGVRACLVIQPMTRVRLLVAPTTYQLTGNLDPVSLREILAGAKRMGLIMCGPEEVALLRLEYGDQPSYEMLRVLVATDADPLLFEVSNIGKLNLDCASCNLELEYSGDLKWVFLRP